MVLQAIGSALGGLAQSFFGGSGSSVASAAAGWIASKEGAKQQHAYNKESMALAQKYNQSNMKLQQDYNLSAMKYSYDLSRQLEDRNNAWSAQMSNTAHQREVADLRAAGLNPILSANNGASTPGASGATISPLGGTALGSSPLGTNAPDYNSAFENVMRYQGMKNETNLTSGQVSDLKASAALKHEQAVTQGKQQQLIDQQKASLIAQTAADIQLKNRQGIAALNNADANTISASAKSRDTQYKIESGYYEKANVHPYYNSVKQLVKDATKLYKKGQNYLNNHPVDLKRYK